MSTRFIITIRLFTDISILCIIVIRQLAAIHMTYPINRDMFLYLHSWGYQEKL